MTAFQRKEKAAKRVHCVTGGKNYFVRRSKIIFWNV